MKTCLIPVSQEELLALSSEFRQRTRDSITAKRVPTANIVSGKSYEINDDFKFSELPPAAAYILSDPIEAYLNSFAPEDRPDHVVVAKDSIALRCIQIKVDMQNNVDAILDPGCQVIAMSEGVCADVDAIISAQIPDPETQPMLYDVITKSMVHGPCGTIEPKAKCMANGKCTKRYPKEFRETTHYGDDGYPKYARPDNGRTFEKNGHVYDNRDVVPYSPYLSAKFNCHINAEICKSVLLLSQSSTFTNISTRVMTEPPWSCLETRKEMRSRSTLMHGIFLA